VSKYIFAYLIFFCLRFRHTAHTIAQEKEGVMQRRKTLDQIEADGPISKFTVSVPRDLTLELEAHCRRYGYTSRSMFIRRAIMAELERERRRARMDD